MLKNKKQLVKNYLKLKQLIGLRHLEILRELSEVKSKIDEQQSIIDISKNDLEQLNFSYNEQLNNELFDLKKQKAELKKEYKNIQIVSIELFLKVLFLE